MNSNPMVYGTYACGYYSPIFLQIFSILATKLLEYGDR